MIVSWDTETELIRPGVNAPRVACMSICAETTAEHPATWPAYLVDRHTAHATLGALLGHASFTGANIAYDVCVMMADNPALVPQFFDAYDADQFTDVLVRQKLLDIAAGKFRGEFRGVKFVRYGYGLSDVSRRVAGWALEKTDTWRLRYGELMDTPIDAWPEAARTYPLDDARAPLAIYHAQEHHREYLEDQFRQTRRELWLKLMSTWGIRTHAAGVYAFASDVQGSMDEMQAELITLGLVRSNGVRDTKAAAQLMVDVCASKGLAVVPTMTEKTKLKENPNHVWDPATLKGVCLDADACKRVDDWRLNVYSKFSTMKSVLSKDVPMLMSGIEYPIHSHFEGPIETGRISSSAPNLTNVRTLPGIRECFIPRPGKVFMQADYPGVELRTLAQTCINILGYSTLGDALRAGKDPHCILAANILGIDYEECIARHKAKDPIVKAKRDLAKRANFGMAGGAGVDTFMRVANSKPYYMGLDRETVKHLKGVWLETWKEMPEYFRWAAAQTANDTKAAFWQIGSRRLRANLWFTELCNTPFQGLAADATSEAGWLITKAMYDARLRSPLYGSRLVDFVHDEFIGETDDNANASDAVLAMCALMAEGANRWIPDVPYTVADIEPVLMTHWSKDAATIIENGRVQVWRGKAA